MAQAVGTPPLRRSSRVHIRVPVTISGILPDGNKFSTVAQVLTVSKFGARIKTGVRLEVGAELRVETRQNQSALFRVVWVAQEGTPRAGEMGVEYLELSNLLGIRFPD